MEDGRRDPLEAAADLRQPPATFGMDRDMRAEARRCWNSGWLAWEIHYRFHLEAVAA